MNTINPIIALCGDVGLISGAGGGLGAGGGKSLRRSGRLCGIAGQSGKPTGNSPPRIVGSGFTRPAIYPLDLRRQRRPTSANWPGFLTSSLVCCTDCCTRHRHRRIGTSSRHKSGPMGASIAHKPIGSPWPDMGGLPLLQRAGDASLVFTSNSSARLGKAYWGAYGVAGIALEGMARMWSDELASAGRVRVTFCAGSGELAFAPKNPSRPFAGGKPIARKPCGPLRILLGPASQGVNGQIIEGPG